MKTPIENLPNIKRLLINSWSAEYALRKTPLNSEDTTPYQISTLSWTFPQSYYAVLFAVRAYQCSRNIFNGGESSVLHQIQSDIATRVYAETLDWTGPNTDHFVAEMLNYCIGKNNPLHDQLETDIVAQHKRLLDTVRRITRWHMAKIQEYVGAQAFREILNESPEYIQDTLFGNLNVS